MFNTLPTPGEVKITWEPGLDPKNLAEHYKATFDIDGDPYVVGFSRVETVHTKDFYIAWDFDIKRAGWMQKIKSLWSGVGLTYKRTGFGEKKGMGYTIQVLKGVLAAIHEFVAAIRPTILSYYGHDEKLKGFYDHVANKIAPKYGYKPYRGHSGFLVQSDKMNSPTVAKAIASHLRGELG